MYRLSSSTKTRKVWKGEKKEEAENHVLRDKQERVSLNVNPVTGTEVF